ncbi:MAG: tetratricopeptide repeat protein [Candidatus Krumholzibacteriia bacterium]
MPFQKMNASKERAARRAAGAVVIAAALLLAACGPARNDERYTAEKKLFKARKLKEDLYAGGMRSEFLAKAAEAYRGIVRDYGDSAGKVAGIEEIVVSAQMELGELEYRGRLLREARNDFEKAVELAKNVPAALANALYSAGVISEELGESAEAIRYYTRFSERFLAADSLARTVSMNPRYLVTPLKLAELTSRHGDRDGARRWLKEAERVFSFVIGTEKDPAILRETRYNLLAAYLQQKDWARGRDLTNELKKLYRDNPQDLSSLLYIEAKIYEDGLKDESKALELYQSVVDVYPKSREAPDAVITAAGIHRNAGRLDEAAKLYGTIIDLFKDRISAVVEAQWQLAHIEELKGDPEAASLRYRLIYTDYPETLQGFEAPLRIAFIYRERGAGDAAKAAYDQALKHYEKLISGQRPPATKIMAEQYIIRTLTEDKRWKEAAEHLTAIPDRYPDYSPFRENYLRAASIYEKELGDKEEAIRALETCVAKHPGTDIAGVANKELARLKR